MTPYWKNRRVWAWASYDFANSAFATTILAVVFNVYFAQKVVPPDGALIAGVRVPGPSLWGYTVSLSMLVTFLISPVLGAMADHTSRKKLFLAVHWLVGCAATAGLFFVEPGDVGLAAGLFMAANVGFAGSNVFYNAFLPGLAAPSALGRVSGLGWALGYVGGGLCLALNLAMIKSPATFGLSPDRFLPVRASFLSVAAWWFVFGLPIFSITERPRAAAARENVLALVRFSVARLKNTFRDLRRYGNLLTFLAAFLIYNDGIDTIILMASLFGARALGMTQEDLILCFLMIQGVAFVGALAFGWLADRIRHKPAIGVTLAVYGGVLVWAYVMTSSREFWMLGVVVGLVLGGSQAASRSLMALLTPPEKSAEFFAFFGLVGKFTSAFGPLVFGVVSQAWGLRTGVLSLLVFFVAGGLLLTWVKEPRPKAS